MDIFYWQWVLILGSSALLFWLSPLTNKKEGFFLGKSKQHVEPSFWLLTTSLVISWIFAKSITNAANLSQSFGIVGGLAYAAYYLSFFTAGVIIYYMRTQGKFQSIHHFLHTRFGRSAVIVFSLLIGIRLFNEVWSNSAVIGNYFGQVNSFMYVLSIVVFTGLTLAYAVKGGMRSSLITDMIQFILFGVLLFTVLGIIVPAQGSVFDFFTTGTWSMATGLNLMIVALIQIFSYPFHDPVMTDRGFIANPKKTLRSFFVAGVLGIVFITLFSFVGIHASSLGIEGDASVGVAQTLGVGMMLLINFIMITSAASTLDSTFTSSAKLAVIDLGLGKHAQVSTARFIMMCVALFGLLPLFFSPEIISATTISGTMVIGLAPVFMFFFLRAPRASFHLSVFAGVAAGLILILGWVPESLVFTTGKYAELLAVNVYGSLLCFALYFAPFLFQHHDIR